MIYDSKIYSKMYSTHELIFVMRSLYCIFIRILNFKREKSVDVTFLHLLLFLNYLFLNFAIFILFFWKIRRVYLYIYIYLSIHLSIYLSILIILYIYIYICIYIYIYIHIYISIYIYIYIYIYMYIYVYRKIYP